MVIIEMENGKKMKVELYPDIAPKTCENFEKLVKQGFYDGLTFHRVIPGFMIQGGCPDGTGMGGPGWSIDGEFTSNGFKNDLKHTRGVISMARSMMPNSAGSQFFIMHADSPHLDGDYAAFGKVIEGIEAVDEIAETETDRNDKPKTPRCFIFYSFISFSALASFTAIQNISIAVLSSSTDGYVGAILIFLSSGSFL